MNPAYNSNNAKVLNIERRKEYKKEYEKSEKRKKYKEEYNNQLCSYNGETIALATLAKRFQRSGITHSAKEARKYLVL